MPHILALTKHSNKNPSSRIRFIQYFDYLRSAGLKVTHTPLLGNTYLENRIARKSTSSVFICTSYLKRAWLLLTKLSNYDILWIEYELFPYIPFWLEKLFLRKKTKVVVDYDDAVFHTYDKNKHWVVRKILGRKISSVIKNADSVVCGNQYLASYARQSGVKSLTIIPSVIDLEEYQPRLKLAAKKKSKPIIIGWIGSPSTTPFLKLANPALEALAKLRNIELHTMGAAKNYHINSVNHTAHSWTIDKQYCFLDNIDIGIMPLDDTAWCKGKCGYKLIQYLAYSKPVIASPVGINSEIVTHGVNGYLASSINEWLEALKQLCDSEEKRLTMGKAGRECVEKTYSLQANSEKILEAFNYALSPSNKKTVKIGVNYY